MVQLKLASTAIDKSADALRAFEYQNRSILRITCVYEPIDGQFLAGIEPVRPLTGAVCARALGVHDKVACGMGENPSDALHALATLLGKHDELILTREPVKRPAEIEKLVAIPKELFGGSRI